MGKQEFLEQLRKQFSSLPQADIEEQLSFYSEMIDDRMEEGLSEEDAVSAVGSVDEIANQILADTPLTKIVKERITPKRKLSAWEITLLAVGFPVWGSLLISAFAVLFSLYASVWAVVVSLWVSFGAVAGSSLGGVLGGILFICQGHLLSGLATIGAGLVCAGLAILLFYGCKAAVVGTIFLTKKLLLGIKRCFTGKEAA